MYDCVAQLSPGLTTGPSYLVKDGYGAVNWAARTLELHVAPALSPLNISEAIREK